MKHGKLSRRFALVSRYQDSNLSIAINLLWFAQKIILLVTSVERPYRTVLEIPLLQ